MSRFAEKWFRWRNKDFIFAFETYKGLTLNIHYNFGLFSFDIGLGIIFVFMIDTQNMNPPNREKEKPTYKMVNFNV